MLGPPYRSTEMPCFRSDDVLATDDHSIVLEWLKVTQISRIVVLFRRESSKQDRGFPLDHGDVARICPPRADLGVEASADVTIASSRTKDSELL